MQKLTHPSPTTREIVKPGELTEIGFQTGGLPSCGLDALKCFGDHPRVFRSAGDRLEDPLDDDWNRSKGSYKPHRKAMTEPLQGTYRAGEAGSSEEGPQAMTTSVTTGEP